MARRGEYLSEIVHALKAAYPLREKVQVGPYIVQVQGWASDGRGNPVSPSAIRPYSLRYGDTIVENLLHAAYYTAVDIPEVAVLRLRDGLLTKPWASYQEAANSTATILFKLCGGQSNVGAQSILGANILLMLVTPFGERALNVHIQSRSGIEPVYTITVSYPLYVLLNINGIVAEVNRYIAPYIAVAGKLD